MSAAFDVAFDPRDVTQFRRVRKDVVGIPTSIWLFIARFAVSLSRRLPLVVNMPRVRSSKEGLTTNKQKEKGRTKVTITITERR